MHATIRRYEGVDQNRTLELTDKVNDTLVPKLSKLPGFAGYYLIEAGNGVFSSIGLFETPEQGLESSKFVASWIRDERLDTMIPNEPKITTGLVVARSNGIKAAVYTKEQWEKTSKNEKIDEKELKPIDLKFSLCHPSGCTAEKPASTASQAGMEKAL